MGCVVVAVVVLCVFLLLLFGFCFSLMFKEFESSIPGQGTVTSTSGQVCRPSNSCCICRDLQARWFEDERERSLVVRCEPR